MSAEHVDVRCIAAEFRPGRGEHHVVIVRAGVPTVTHVVPPAGEAHAFDRTDFPVEVQVSVSPSGRSVQVYVNGALVARGRGGRVETGLS